MSVQNDTWYGLDVAERRPWPALALIQKSLLNLGFSFEVLHFNTLGARTAKIVGVRGHSKERIIIARQRNPDPRIVCPLEEEYSAIQQMYTQCPGLVPEPIGVITLNHGESLLVFRWVDGMCLGSRLQVHKYAEEVFSIVASALSTFHTIGRRCELSGLTRQVRVDRLLDAAERSHLRGVIVPSEHWDRAIASLREVTDGLGFPTLIHGDAHAYNLMETPSGQCWVDFERLAVGPPELDNASAWVLLQAQARRELISLWDSDAQLICDFLAVTNFLEFPSTIFKGKARVAIEALFHNIMRRIL